MCAGKTQLLGLTPASDWQVYSFGGGYTYREIPWDEIPGFEMDKLTVKLVNDLMDPLR